MIITADMVGELRKLTGAGVMDCKKALVESNGSLEKAINKMKNNSIYTINKRMSGVAKEGLVAISYSTLLKKVTMIEVNSQTDFVARSDSFKNFVYNLSHVILKNDAVSVEDILQLILYSGKTVHEELNALILQVGEKVFLRRVSIMEGDGLACYNHSNRIGVILQIESANNYLVKDLAMHIAALNPLVISQDCMPNTILERERKLFIKQVSLMGKSDIIAQNIVSGKMNKFLDENSLLGQKFVKNSDQKVSNLLMSNNVKIKAFSRFLIGEDIVM
jgi:elongation factor Ts